jgi:hypothetical protein
MDLTDDTPVKLVSTDDRSFDCAVRPQGTPYGQTLTYRIGAKETVFWTWRVAKHFLGNPYLRDVPGYDEATQERSRVQDGFGYLQLAGDDKASYRPPSIKVYSMDGTHIPMANEISVGEQALAAPLTSDDLQARIDAMQAEIDMLRSNTTTDLPEVVVESTPELADEPVPTSLDDIPDDTSTPSRAPAGASPGPGPAPADPSLTAQLQ